MSFDSVSCRLIIELRLLADGLGQLEPDDSHAAHDAARTAGSACAAVPIAQRHRGARHRSTLISALTVLFQRSAIKCQLQTSAHPLAWHELALPCTAFPRLVSQEVCPAPVQLPLYPATTIYLQLMSESRSRINACDVGVGTGVSCATRIQF